MGTAWILERAHVQSRRRAFSPPLLIAADIAALAGFCYLTSSPEQLHRILLLGFLSMQLGVFYFGRAQGIARRGLTIAAYLLFTLGVPAFVPGAAADGDGRRVQRDALRDHQHGARLHVRQLSRADGRAARVLQRREAE